MKEVSIQFSNIQSHEDTRFVLKPGLNCILGEGNNIGKSAIFNLLMDMANNYKSPGWIARLIRNGTNRAFAAFDFDTDGQRERVVVWLQLTKPGAATMFFEQSFDGGEPVRLTDCPQSLLDALGIAVTPDSGIINFNSADSTQLLSKASSESDAVISHVMMDERTERLKEQAADLSRTVVSDYRDLYSKVEAMHGILSSMSYNQVVDEFYAREEWLSSAVAVADAVPKEDMDVLAKTSATAEKDSEAIESLFNVLFALEPACDMPECKGEDYLRVAGSAKAILEVVTPEDLKELRRPIPKEHDLNNILRIYKVAKKLREILDLVREFVEAGSAIASLEEDMTKITEELRVNTERVMCPVKGEVLFSSEYCIPVGDGLTL